MRDYAYETKRRVEFIQQTLSSAQVQGIVFGNSGGKDSALVGVLCKMACENTLGLIMPCGSKQNYGQDKTDAEAVAKQYGIMTRMIDLSSVKIELTWTLGKSTQLTDSALENLAPRLRMTALYAVAASESRLVAGTGNRSENYVGYFTKWGDGAYDFNPIADLTVTEIYEFLRYLGMPKSILDKAPSAGLFDGQADEEELGIAYSSLDKYLLTEVVNERYRGIIQQLHLVSEHKRRPPTVFETKEITA